LARFFDGTNDKIACGTDSSMDNIFDGGGTICAWAKTNASIIDSDKIMDKVLWPFHFNGPISSVSELVFVQVFSGDNGTWITTSTEVTVAVWTHTALTYDSSNTGDNVTFFIDGASVSDTQNVAPTGTFTSDASNELTIGNRPAQDRTMFGDLAEVAGWDAILVATELQSLGEGTPPLIIRHANLKFYLPLWGNQTPEPDFVAQLNTGTVTEAAQANHPPQSQLLENFL